MKYTTIDRVLSKLYRDLKGTDLNEGDVLEWAGEALDALKVVGTQEEVVTFLEVKGFEAPLPKNFQTMLQVARNNQYDGDPCPPCDIATTTTEEEVVVPIQSSCEDCGQVNVVTYESQSCAELFWNYSTWTTNATYRQKFTPVRLSNNTFFNSLVAQEKDNSCYYGVEDEYTIVGSENCGMLRLSFEEGQVAVSYLKTAVDKTTGYPLVPDNISFITAISYYVRWKIAEWYHWNGREGFGVKSREAEDRWLKYAKQAKNWSKMPKTIDDYQNLLEGSHHLIPNHRRYYGFFGNLGRAEDRGYFDPNNRNR